MKLSGLSLTILIFVLATVNYISLSQNIAMRHNEIIMITIATYTFCKITPTVIKSFKQHKDFSPLKYMLQSITYVEIAASHLTLQRSMLISFGSINYIKINVMNAMTGAFTFLFI